MGCGWPQHPLWVLDTRQGPTVILRPPSPSTFSTLRPWAGRWWGLRVTVREISVLLLFKAKLRSAPLN